MAVQNFNRTASIGALLMSLALVGYALYQLVLWRESAGAMALRAAEA
jgi:hypothetical protein